MEEYMYLNKGDYFSKNTVEFAMSKEEAEEYSSILSKLNDKATFEINDRNVLSVVLPPPISVDPTRNISLKDVAFALKVHKSQADLGIPHETFFFCFQHTSSDGTYCGLFW